VPGRFENQPTGIVRTEKGAFTEVAARKEPVRAPALLARSAIATADQDKGVFSAFKRIPDLLRPDPAPAPTGETPRPPMPVGPASPEIK